MPRVARGHPQDRRRVGARPATRVGRHALEPARLERLRALEKQDPPLGGAALRHRRPVGAAAARPWPRGSASISAVERLSRPPGAASKASCASRDLAGRELVAGKRGRRRVRGQRSPRGVARILHDDVRARDRLGRAAERHGEVHRHARAQLGLGGLGHLVADGVAGQEAAALLRGEAANVEGLAVFRRLGSGDPGGQGQAEQAGEGGRPAQSREHGPILSGPLRNIDEVAHPLHRGPWRSASASAAGCSPRAGAPSG